MKLLLAESGHGSTPGFTLALSIASSEHLIDFASTSEEMIGASYHRDVILLCQRLDDMSGLKALANLRAAGLKTFVIFLCDSQDPQERALALNAGADDAVSLPRLLNGVSIRYFAEEITARAFAVMHRPREEFLSKTLEVGDVRLDLNLGMAFFARGGRKVNLHVTSQEFEMLRILAERKGTVVTREMFLDELYGKPGERPGAKKEPEMKIIDVLICKLREKIKSGLNWDPIDTSWGRGYRLLEAPEPGQMVDKVA